MATGIPNTTQVLNILLPIILPISNSCSPFLDDTIVVTSSGRDVPRAIIVMAIIRSLSPKTVAIALALFTTRSLPRIIPARPITTNIREVVSLYLGNSSSFFSFFL